MVNFSNLPVIKPRATGFGTAEPSVISESMIARRSLGGQTLQESPGLDVALLFAKSLPLCKARRTFFLNLTNSGHKLG